MQNNEYEGLVSGTRAHNNALIVRVQDLAKRVEDLTFSSKHVERLKDEFYQHCADYIDKKKALFTKNQSLKGKLHSERQFRVDLLQ